MTTHDSAQTQPSAFRSAVAAPHAAPSGWARAFDSLTNRNFRILWIGMLFSFTGMQIGQVARQWLVYDLTGSSTALGVVGALTSIPALLLSLPGGVVADRAVKRNLLIITQSATGLTALAIAVLIMTGHIQVWHVMVAAAASGIIFSFNAPGRQALISELVEPHQLMNAIALNSAGMNLTRVIGPSVAGVLVAALGLALTYYIYAAQYVLAVAVLAMLPATVVLRSRESSAVEDMKEGAWHVLRDRRMLVLMLFIIAPVTFGWPYQTLLPVMAGHLGVGSEGFGLMMGAVGVGALAGSLLIASLGDFPYKGLLMLGTGFGFGTTLVLFAYMPDYWAAMAALVAVGTFSTMCMSGNNALLQSLAPEEMRGRVMGIYMITWGLSPLGSVPAGWLGDVIGVPHVIAIGGALTSLAAVLTFVLYPPVRKL